MTMIERIARAIEGWSVMLLEGGHYVLRNDVEVTGPFGGVRQAREEMRRHAARAALQAMMTPSEGMVSGAPWVPFEGAADPRSAYQAMITAALEEGE